MSIRFINFVFTQKPEVVLFILKNRLGRTYTKVKSCYDLTFGMLTFEIAKYVVAVELV